MSIATDRRTLRQALVDEGFVFVVAAAMRDALEARGSLTDWDRFAASWNALEVDRYLVDRGRYRRRRHAVFAAAASGAIVREPDQPHYQGAEYNSLFGGIARWFAPVDRDIADGASLTTILQFCRALFGGLAPAAATWRIEVHQFRIEARADEAGQPTPEGVHRDGVDFVLVLLIARRNIVSGTTTVYAIDRRPLGSLTLTTPFDAVLVDDARVCHGVTPVTPVNPEQPGHRDVLVVTFKRS